MWESCCIYGWKQQMNTTCKYHQSNARAPPKVAKQLLMIAGQKLCKICPIWGDYCHLMGRPLPINGKTAASWLMAKENICAAHWGSPGPVGCPQCGAGQEWPNVGCPLITLQMDIPIPFPTCLVSPPLGGLTDGRADPLDYPCLHPHHPLST